MSSEMIRVLFVSPYEGLRRAVEQAAPLFPNIRLSPCSGDMEEGVRIVRDLGTEEYDAIMSRGGTADLIRAAVSIPVIDIPTSFYDVLRTIRLAESHNNKFAIAGFSRITRTVYTLCALMKYEYKIVTFQSRSDIGPSLDRLKNEGYSTVICDAAAHSLAGQKGMNAFLLTSGEESIREALAMAETQGRTYRSMRAKNRMMQTVLEMEEISTALMSNDGRVIESRPAELPADTIRILRDHLPEALRSSGSRFLFSAGDNLYSVSSRTVAADDNPCVCFAWRTNMVASHSVRPSLRSYGKLECEHQYARSFYAISGAMGNMEPRVDAAAASRQPVMIYGEDGTGKEQIARAVYLRSTLSRGTFVVADCTQMDERTWGFLLGHSASPLNGRNLTVYFQHFELVSQQRVEELRNLLQDSGLSRKIKLIFSYSIGGGRAFPESIRIFVSKLACLTLAMPTLRSRAEEMPSLANQYLELLSNEQERKIAGFEPGAMNLLTDYDWPQNYSQFKRVIQELAVMTASGYITTDITAEMLARERAVSRQIAVAEDGIPVDGRTLEDINIDVVRRALQTNNGNHTRTARQLGISRTTLWRYLEKQG